MFRRKNTPGTLSYAQPQALAVNWKSMALWMLLLTLIPLWWLTEKRPAIEAYAVEELRKLHIPDTPPQPITQSVAVADAFAMIPVEFTPFDADKARMAKEESAYLKSLFDLVNMGVVERVSLLQAVYAADVPENLARNHQEILRRMKHLAFPARLERVHLLIMHAVHEEKQYFDELIANPGRRFDPSAPLVVSADRKLRAAYQELVDTYPDEESSIRQSFYSELCALSFI